MVFAVFFSVPVQAQTTACDILCPPKNHSIPSILSILSIPSKGGRSFSRRFRTCLACRGVELRSNRRREGATPQKRFSWRCLVPSLSLILLHTTHDHLANAHRDLFTLLLPFDCKFHKCHLVVNFCFSQDLEYLSYSRGSIIICWLNE